MTNERPKNSSSAVVRIWREPKKRLMAVQKRKSDREGRPVSEAELVSKAVEKFCDREERKLGIV